jgi:hypothetical protein
MSHEASESMPIFNSAGQTHLNGMPQPEGVLPFEAEFAPTVQELAEELADEALAGAAVGQISLDELDELLFEIFAEQPEIV